MWICTLLTNDSAPSSVCSTLHKCIPWYCSKPGLPTEANLIFSVIFSKLDWLYWNCQRSSWVSTLLTFKSWIREWPLFVFWHLLSHSIYFSWWFTVRLNVSICSGLLPFRKQRRMSAERSDLLESRWMTRVENYNLTGWKSKIYRDIHRVMKFGWITMGRIVAYHSIKDGRMQYIFYILWMAAAQLTAAWFGETKVDILQLLAFVPWRSLFNLFF